MNWILTFFTSSAGKKIIMSLTGLFLCTFLIVHMSGNLALLKNDGGQAFNEYATFMTSFPPIKAVSYITYFFIILHIVQGFALTLGNRKSRPVKYAVTKPAGASLASRNMAILGTVILLFLIGHLSQFWARMKLGSLNMVSYNGVEHTNLYEAVYGAFSNPLIVILYLVALVALGYHLLHGFQSAFRSLGLTHSKYTPIIKTVGWVFTAVVILGFAIQPIFVFVKSMG